METVWMKVRLLDDKVSLYGDEHGGTVLSEMKGGPVIDVAAGTFGEQMRPAVIGSGRRGFVDPKVSFVPLELWSTTKRKTPIYSDPDTKSGTIATLKAGALVQQYNVNVEHAGKTWIHVSGPGGETGYVDADAGLMPEGTQVRVQTNPNGYGHEALMKYGKVVDIPANTSPTNAAAHKNMVIGGLLFSIGFVLTVVTYTMAADGGGTYLICWGPVVFGAIRFVQGWSARKG